MPTAYAPPSDPITSDDILRMGRELSVTSLGPRPRDWDRIRMIQERLSDIGSRTNDLEHAGIKAHLLAVIDDTPRSTTDIVTLANDRLKRLSDMRADVRLALGARMAWSIPERVCKMSAPAAFASLRRDGAIRDMGMLRRRWVRV